MPDCPRLRWRCRAVCATTGEVKATRALENLLLKPSHTVRRGPRVCFYAGHARFAAQLVAGADRGTSHQTPGNLRVFALKP